MSGKVVHCGDVTGVGDETRRPADYDWLESYWEEHPRVEEWHKEHTPEMYYELPFTPNE